MERQKLKVKDFDDRFSMDEKGRLFWDDQKIETRGWRTRDFVVVCIGVAIAFGTLVSSSINTWANVKKLNMPSPPINLSCPANPPALPKAGN
jgi:hypothetical protein